MVKQVQRSEIQGFSKGLSTDLNPINNQPDTTIQEYNFELLKDGTRRRRLGLDREVGGSSISLGLTVEQLKLSATSSYYWEGAAGNPKNKFIVLQIGRTLYFLKANGGLQGQTVLHSYLTINIAESYKLKFGAVEGYLGLSNGTPDIGLIEYNSNTDQFSYSTFRLKIRDLFGIQETINSLFENDKQYRGPLNWQHYYNLYNQGWAIPRKDWQFGDPPPEDAVFLGSNKNINNSPSNSDIVWLGMSRKPITENSLESFEAFHYRQFEGITGSDTIAGKGFFIIDAFNRGSSRSEAWVLHKNKYPQTGNLVGGMNPPADVTTGGPTSVAAHAGRLFFSGCDGVVVGSDARSPNFNNYVFFTQLIRNKQDFSKCYQEGDPTSQESNDVVDTDGGTFKVSEAINIHTMYSMGDRLFLIAENGVWSVSGGNSYGFSATNYKVDKLSTYGGIPNHSFVEYGGQGYFWGWDGIYTIAKDQYGDYRVENLSKPIIDNFYQDITDEARQTVKGFVDKARRQIRWIYTEGDLFGSAVSKELIIDLKFQAFYPFTVMTHPTNDAFVLSGIQLGDYTTEFVEESVMVIGDDVYVNSEIVASPVGVNRATDSNVKYVTVRRIAGSLYLDVCMYRSGTFEDWGFTGSPVDAQALMISNAFTAGDFAVNKQVPYVTMAFAETEKVFNGETVATESSCIGQFMWSFTHAARSNKWSREQQLYRKHKYYYGNTDVDNGFSLNITKTKVRGIGKSFSLRVRTEPLKDCHIYGWNLSLTGNGMA